MTLATRTVTLPGGLQATLVHQPQADRAAALTRVAAGSHHEPSRFPGLAHLLEHLLFYGGERYQDDDRLMGWVQRQGGSVNAPPWLAIARSFSRLPPMLWLMASRVYRRCCRPRCCSGKIFSAKWR